jgi:hypothetical protein
MSQQQPTHVADCAAVARLLPLAGHFLLSADESATLDAHVATCAACRAELAVYERVEAAWRRTFEPRWETPQLVSRRSMMDILTQEPEQHAPSTTPDVPFTPRTQPRRALGSLSAVAATLLIVVLMGGILLARGHGSPASGGTGPATVIAESTLGDVAMVSPTEGWAVGGSSGTASPAKIVLMHYLRGVWTPAYPPIDGYLTSLSMSSPTEGWAVGQVPLTQPTQSAPLLLHYDGRTWKQVAVTAQNGQPAQVQMLSATDGWMVGQGFARQAAPLGDIWHYDGQIWTAQPLPASLSASIPLQSAYVSRIAMISPTEGWAIGGASSITSSTSFILHFTGGSWTVQRLLTGVSVQSIAMVSASDGWITATGTDNAPLLLRYTGGRWVEATASIGNSGTLGRLLDVFMRSATEGWMTGQVRDFRGSPTLLHYDGTKWSVSSLPSITSTSTWDIRGITMISATEGWAVGEHEVKSPNYLTLVTPVILHYHNGRWSDYTWQDYLTPSPHGPLIEIPVG